MADEGYMLPPLAGLAPIPGMGQSYLPELYSVPYEATVPDIEPVEKRHPWKATASSPNVFTVAGGKVFGSNDTSVEITDPFLADTVNGLNVWVKITRSGTEVTAAEFGQGGDIPADTAELLHRLVVSFFDVGGLPPYYSIDQIESSHLRVGADGGSSVNHMWKVTKSSEVDPDSLDRIWVVKGGSVYSQGGTFVVESTTVALSIGHIYLSVTRDVDSREITDVAVLYGDTIPDSDYALQYIPIAEVDNTDTNPPLQLLFEEVRIYEEMSVQNGEFKLNAYHVAHRNRYDPPAP